ncbi:MAG: DUF4129 domain-containing protein [Chloroflexota bacterium]
MSRPALPSRLMYLWLAIAEMSGLYLALALVSRYLGGDFTISAVGIVIYALACLFGLIIFGPWRLWLNIVLGVVAVGVVAVLVSARITSATDLNVVGASSLQVVLAGFAWWLGVTVVPNYPDYIRLAVRFQWGLLVLLLLAGLEGQSFLPVMLFALGGATVLALGRWHDSLRRTGVVLRPPHLWMLAAGLAAVVVPVIAAFFALSPGTAAAVVNGLSVAAGWLFPPPSVAPSERQFTFKLSCDFQPEDEGMMELPEPVHGSAQPLAPWAVWVVIAFILAVVIAGVVIAAKRLRWRRTTESGPLRIETVAIGVSLWSGLVGLFHRIARALFDLVRCISRVFWWRAFQVEDQVATVRAVYRSLLAWAARHGLARLPSQTPLEYERTLSAVYPDLAGDFNTITAAYVEARYSRISVASEVSLAVKGAWERVQTSLENQEHVRRSGG